jgi:hypothetical protein
MLRARVFRKKAQQTNCVIKQFPLRGAKSCQENKAERGLFKNMINRLKKIASVLASAAVLGSSVALAVAANYPAPFVKSGAADVAVVYGANSASTDFVAVTDITTSLQSALSAQATTTASTGESAGGDYVRLDKASDKLNIRDAMSAAISSTLDKDDMTELLADGKFVANDKDEFSYEQKITLGATTLSHFRDSDYETLLGLTEKTPVVGFRMTSGTFVMNYTLEFLTDAESDVVSGDLEDIEGADLPLLGKKYYVSDAKNGTNAVTMGVWTLLDSASTAIVKEGETITVTTGGKSYDVSIDFIDSDSTALIINRVSTDDLAEGASEKISTTGAYVGIRDVRKLAVAGEVGSVEFSIGSGKLEITSGSDIKLNDETITGIKGYVFKGAYSGATAKVDKVVIEWKTDDEQFLTPKSELVFPGFGGIKFSMKELIRPTEEVVKVEKDDDTSLKITVPIKDGDAEIDILYGNATDFTGIGKSSTERLAMSKNHVIKYYNQRNSADYDEYVVVTYNTTTAGESYLLSFDVSTDTNAERNETEIKDRVTGKTIRTDKVAGDVINVGDASFTITEVGKNSTAEWVNLTAGSNTNFNTIITKGGLKIYLPFEDANGTTTKGAINVSDGCTKVAGYGGTSWYLFMQDEDKDDNIASGTAFSMTLDQTSGGKYQVASVNTTGGGAGAGNGGENGLEKGSNTAIYEAYVRDDVAAKVIHYTKPDEDTAEVYYPTGDSQTFAEVYISSEASSIAGSSSAELGSVSVKDSEAASVASKNLIVVGGSCVNIVAAELLGSAAPMCGAAWETKTGAGDGKFLIQTFSRTGGKVATLVAGYNAGDTTNAAKYLTTATVDTTAGKKYVGTTATSAELVTA